MQNQEYQKLLETSWRRRLTATEEARLHAVLEATPEAKQAWEADLALSRLLDRLPDVPVASNFTAQVMSAVKSSQERQAPSLGERCGNWVRTWWPKTAWACLTLLLGFVAFQGYLQYNRSRLARDLAQMPSVETMPSPMVLADFDAVQQLGLITAVSYETQPASDEDLLKALQ